MLSYSRSRGIFAGISLEGATLRQDLDANKSLYGTRLTTKEIVRDPNVKPTPAGRKFVSTLEQYTNRKA